MLRMSLPLVLSVDCVCGRTSRYILNIGKYRFLYFPNRTLIAFVKGPLLDSFSSNQACLRQDFQVFTCGWMADAKFFGNQTAADSVPDKVPGDLRRKVLPRVLQPEQYSEPVLIGQRPKHAICIVATHSGYFVARQFLAFAGVGWGKRTNQFWTKLQSNKHARIGALPRYRA